MPDPASPPRGSATARRRRQVRWGRRLRRVGLAWQNALEIMRAGRLSAPYGAPFEVAFHTPIFRLRHYAAATAPTSAPVLLVPPLMVASEVYDIAPDVSAVVYLTRAGLDVWLIDFGAPEREAGGLDRTLDDHVRAVSEAIDQVRAATGRDVHLAGYSQGGMFAYQAAAFRRSAGIASLITFGSPVDVHRSVPIADQIVEQLVAGAQRAIAGPLARLEGLPGFLTSTGFKLLSARKEATQLVDFVRKLHDRQALEKREARRLFLGGQGFVAWPGPALRKFIDEIIVANRMTSGGIVIDGRSVSLADIDSPILYFVGDRDEMGRPAAVRGIRRAAPAVEQMFEVMVKAGHFGLVVGSTALTVTWPIVVEWVRWRDGDGPAPARMTPAGEASPAPGAAAALDEDDDLEDDDLDGALGEVQYDLELAGDVVGKTARALWERVGDATTDLSDYLDNLRWQVPRLHRLRSLRDDTVLSLGQALAEQAKAIPERTFFLWRDRAFTYAEANRRVDAVVRGLIHAGIRPGQRVAVVMTGRPSYLSVVAALSRLGAVSVLVSPELTEPSLRRALDIGEAEAVIADPDDAAAVRAAFSGKLLILGGAHQSRRLPAGVIDLEAIDPETVPLPAWFKPDPGRARDLAMVFIVGGRHDAPRANRVTNRRWGFSALGAAATCTLTNRDTVYCALPLHHPTGMLVAAGSALVGGARLALASQFTPATFWQEVRRYGVSVVFYAGEMARSLVHAPPGVGERNHPVRLFAGSGMRPDLWRRLTERFGAVGVLEFYASTEASAVLANAAGEQIGAVGHPLPGSPELAVAAYDFDAEQLVHDSRGRLVRAAVDQPGMLVARLDSSRGIADIGHIAPTRLVHDGFGPGDTWFVTGDLLRIDAGGTYWFVDRAGDMIRTAGGPVASRRVEDALHGVDAVVGCVAVAIPDPAAAGKELVAAAVALATDAPLDLAALAQAATALPEHARPRRLRRVAAIPMTDGYRPLKQPLRELGFADGPDVFTWDPTTNRFRPSR
ncbi:MAG: alpha/beta fold hydrolase [Kofleriaceae bacterium]